MGKKTLGFVFAAAVLVGLSATAIFASPAGAYGGGASHDMWQIGISFNCNNPSFCGDDELGGFWGWVEFDRAGSDTWGDAELAGCGHTIGHGGPGLAGAGHFSAEIEGWIIAPGSAGAETFWITSGTQTDTGHGKPITGPILDENGNEATPDNPDDTGIPATSGHYNTTDILGFQAPPGVAIQIQVAFRPAK